MQPFDRYLALGDSMSIDKYAGTGLGAASLLFRNSDETWPEFRGHDLSHLNPVARFRLLAEDGAASEDTERAVAGLAAESGRTLITLTLGGNDLLRWWAMGAVDVERMLASFSLRFDRILAQLRALYRDAVIVLANVYDPTDGSGRVQSGRDMSAGLPVLAAMNATIADIARRQGLALADVHGHFLGHGLRHSDPASPHYRSDDPSGWFMFDIEPNPRGSSEIRRLLWKAIAS